MPHQYRTEQQKLDRKAMEVGARQQWDPSIPRLCGCGCGGHVKSKGGRFLHGHHMRLAKNKRKRTAVAVVNKCRICGTEFVSKSSPWKQQSFCSVRCRGLARRTRVNYVCAHCRGDFETHLYQSKRRRFCSRKCQRESEREKCLQGDTTHYRKTAYAHYQRRCCFCGFREYPGVLVVHHVDGDHSNNDPENLSVVCPTCHAIQHLLMGAKHLPSLGRKKPGPRSD